MIIKIYYSGGRIDVFDANRIFESYPKPQYLLMNYTIDLADISGGCLWLRSFYYESSPKYNERMSSEELPIARRRDGWCFLLADENDLEGIIQITIDGELVLAQIAGELVDIRAINWAYEVESALVPKIKRACSFLLATEFSTPSDLEKKLGVPYSLIKSIGEAPSN